MVSSGENLVLKTNQKGCQGVGCCLCPPEQPPPLSWARLQMHEGIVVPREGVSLNFRFRDPEEGNEGKASIAPSRKPVEGSSAFGCLGVQEEEQHRLPLPLAWIRSLLCPVAECGNQNPLPRPNFFDPATHPRALHWFTSCQSY